jgi:DNA-binding transcriptional MerR regulator
VSERPLKMKDLCELTGLSRQAIHFYIQQGLLPEGRKTGRNMAWYGPEHVERLRQIQKLQDERMLPLKAIKAVLAGETADLEPTKRALLVEVASRLAPTRPGMVDAAESAARHGVELAEVERMAEMGFIASRKDGDRLEIAADALWMLDIWGQFRALGFTEQLGFTVDDLQIYDEAVQNLFRTETRLLVDRVAGLPPAEVAQMIEQVLPLVHAVLIHLHTASVRHFFGALQR